HVHELTQPFGHSTSGSHERYKPDDRLSWEEEYDCNRKFKEWILSNGIASEEDLVQIEKEATDKVREARQRAWDAYTSSMRGDFDLALQGLNAAVHESRSSEVINGIYEQLRKTLNPYRTDAVKAVKKVLRLMHDERVASKTTLQQWIRRTTEENKQRYNSHLYSQSAESALNVPFRPPVYNTDSPMVDGREVVQHNFEALFRKDPRLVAFGEDVGQIGDVNQGFAGLQEKFGINRIVDTGIRETTIIGQALGMAMRGLRPIAEVQYLDYLLFCIQTLSDDVATLQYRTAGGQKAPLIVRTRGHRLEGMFHAGSPISMILGAVRGMYVLVPRDLTQAAGMYNTMLQSDDPALIIESLNAYRLKERMPANLGEFTIPLGVPETIRQGTDVTIVTYGSMCRIVLEAAEELQALGISCEVIDVQTLLPFDRYHLIVESIKKTNRVIFADEDVSGGASAYMMQKVLDEQDAYRWLDTPPRCISAQDHRTAYSTDGDYFSKSNPEDVIDTVYKMMGECFPDQFPDLYN
ncbi:MAG TPA: transketolase C-terminal domain-containing protein, partial [Cytophagaceae bacterium]|nr:transketolase C-terminal domain-containing protein [Cytophagaceae bacterium]